VSRYQKGKTNLDFTEARDSECQWHQLGCTSLQAENHTSTQPINFFTGRMPFLPPNQQCQSTEGINVKQWRENFTGTVMYVLQKSRITHQSLAKWIVASSMGHFSPLILVTKSTWAALWDS